MCDQLSNKKIIYDINSISKYILSDCRCNYCLLVEKQYNAMKIIVTFLLTNIRNGRKFSKSYNSKNNSLYKRVINNTCISLIFQDIFKINILSIKE